ncbi:hypothetical protein [Serratia proteamaculans]|jgi:hypothetical protein|uniref:hypothetical protein n=1 Tax=Serratia proteamaculans TaxID=28151 RepID=UPI00217A4F0E|nr:hypothetical protein [Serratia proteamaculans]CAI1584388.1 Uncharacterised protein [Serratia proteamaculans]CAI2484723.1 Uncharacterised protein [Serratia proteamaculans]
MQTTISMVPDGFQLPRFEHMFHPIGLNGILLATSDESNGITKKAGTGDSGGKRSSVKAPGGKDSRKQKDGG